MGAWVISAGAGDGACVASLAQARFSRRMQHEIAAWEADRNDQRPKINWSFRHQDARLKLESLYPNPTD